MAAQVSSWGSVPRDDDAEESVILSPLYMEGGPVVDRNNRSAINSKVDVGDKHTTGSGSAESEVDMHGIGANGSGVFGASFNFANSIVGAGIIGIPYAVSQCGFYTGIAMLIAVALIVYNAVVMLIECGIRVDKLDLEELSLHLIGDKGYLLALTVMFMFGFGAMIAYMVIVGDTIPAVAEQLFSPDNIFANRSFSMIFVAIVVMLPLCLLKDLSSLSWASMISLLSDIVIITCICIYAPIEAHKPGNTAVSTSDLSIFSSGIFAGIGAISFAFVCQHNSFMVFRSLKEPTLDNWKKVACYSLVFALSLSLCVGIIGYFCFGESTKGDLLNNFPANHFMMNISRSLLACCMACTYPMECYVARHCLLKIVHRYGPTHLTLCGIDLSSYLGGPSHSSSQGSFVILSSNDTIAIDSNSIESSSKPSYNNIRNTNNSNPSNHSDNNSNNISNRICSSLRNHPNRSHLNPLYLSITLALWMCSVAIAVSAENLGIVLSLTGCAAASFLGYILPALIYIYSFHTEFWEFTSIVRGQPLELMKHYFNSIYCNICSNSEIKDTEYMINIGTICHINRFSLCCLMILFGILLFIFGISTVAIQNER